MNIRSLFSCLLAVLLCANVAMADGLAVPVDDRSAIEENLPARGETVVTDEKTTVFKSADWHKNKWQNSPAIIEITEAYINLLFNRPEIVFGLRRGIRFDWQDTHEYTDGKVVTTYHFRRTAEGKALIEYRSVLLEDSTQIASGSFEIEPRP
ncbi:MAG: hypothetical protein GQF41_2103 [Candidatus Rifleibacterium amylolyticum]|nr:MAG: hypothetical protein GQF41_2103 [Candidatus Rifleibacterium amylolyticum]NLF98444.1 hypothetical protein [Candidatus Riflebacteria bacterium]